MKAYTDIHNRVRYMVYADAGAAMFDCDYIGKLLVEFLLADLSEYKCKVDQAKETISTMHTDTKHMNDNDITIVSKISEQYLYEIVTILYQSFPIAHFYTREKLNVIFQSQNPYPEKLQLGVATLDEVLVLLELFEKGITFCCDIDFDKPLSSITAGFLSFLGLYPDFSNFHFLTGVSVAPTKNGKLDFEQQELIGTNASSNLQRHMDILTEIHNLNTTSANITEYVLLKDFEELLYFEFIEVIKRGLRIRKCQNCNRYFVLLSKHDTLYCDRVDTNGKSCKEIGNKQKYKENVEKDPLLKMYSKLYKSTHARMERHVDNEYDLDVANHIRDSFLNWSKQLQQVRRDYVNGCMTAEEFRDWMEGRTWDG